ncbi:deoxyguanosine kinase [Cyprinid herpesvirus 1]|uniref:Deoxyguanosine kinase n=1 Tax=Cyprinid herpesvirus 1 TaxID=317858 RepID=K7PCJ7_9VIRU|nr:deoxyguanosine kinase [Cyprinid herpesvirus 1]AFJ20325.1 deoxyguanosine kinase [Cyprinid herpesvirus 1]
MSLKRVSVEGNLGAGKSTFIGDLKESAEIRQWAVMDEPIDRWIDVCGQGNLLDMYYKDPKRWGFTFQTHAYQSRIQKQTEIERSLPADTEVMVYERSCYSDRFIFAEAARAAGKLSAVEFAAYGAAHTFFSSMMESCFAIHGVVYLRARPDTCLARVNQRSRPEETSVAIDYLTRVHNLHEDWLMARKGPCTQYPAMSRVPVLVVDVDDYDCSDDDRRAALIHKVTAFISSL